jgi:hypothetical protein
VAKAVVVTEITNKVEGAHQFLPQNQRQSLHQQVAQAMVVGAQLGADEALVIRTQAVVPLVEIAMGASISDHSIPIPDSRSTLPGNTTGSHPR